MPILPGFWLWQGSQNAHVTQCSGYARICLDRVLNISWVLNMLRFWNCRVLTRQMLHRVLNMPQYGWICLNRMWICLNMSGFMIIDRVLNMYHTIYRVRLLCKLINTYWEIGVFRTWSKEVNPMEGSGKIIIVLTVFAKNSTLDLWEDSEYVLGFKCARVLNIGKFL